MILLLTKVASILYKDIIVAGDGLWAKRIESTKEALCGVRGNGRGGDSTPSSGRGCPRKEPIVHKVEEILASSLEKTAREGTGGCLLSGCRQGGRGAYPRRK